MKPPRTEELQTIVSQGRWDRAAAILERLDPEVAADAFMSIPYEEQQVLFRRLPIEFAAKLATVFPYYHAFVLLHTLSMGQMTAVIEKMNPIERGLFSRNCPTEFGSRSSKNWRQNQRSSPSSRKRSPRRPS